MTVEESGVGQIDVGARGTEYLVARVLHYRESEPSEPPRIGVLQDGKTLTIDAPAPGETVTVTIEAVDDHA